MTKNGVYPTVILRVSYGYPSVKAVNDLIFSETLFVCVQVQAHRNLPKNIE